MFAVVEIASTQFEVGPNKVIKVPLLNGNPGDTVSFSNVLIAGSDGKETSVGTPYLEGSVEGTILGHGKDKKVIVFKKKRRKGYRRFNGHRQQFTKIEITGMNISGFDSFKGKALNEITKDVIVEEVVVEESDSME